MNKICEIRVQLIDLVGEKKNNKFDIVIKNLTFFLLFKIYNWFIFIFTKKNISYVITKKKLHESLTLCK
jgi:hypothetical protein